MDIIEATDAYENWLAAYLPTGLVDDDLCKKHKKMAGRSPFPFLRATFYRWAQRWPDVCARHKPLAALPGCREVTAVGDLHVENFGTWRDADGRLVWGVNDFDEASPMPFTSDLVRLVTSAALAAQEGVLSADLPAAAGAVLDGYRQGIMAGGKGQPAWQGTARPFVIDQANRWLAVLANNRDPATYWKDLRADLDDLKGAGGCDGKKKGKKHGKSDDGGNGGIPPDAADLLRRALPEPPPDAADVRYYRRQAGGIL